MLYQREETNVNYRDELAQAIATHSGGYDAKADPSDYELADKVIARLAHAWDEGWHSRWDGGAPQRILSNPYVAPAAIG